MCARPYHIVYFRCFDLRTLFSNKSFVCPFTGYTGNWAFCFGFRILCSSFGNHVLSEFHMFFNIKVVIITVLSTRSCVLTDTEFLLSGVRGVLLGCLLARLGLLSAFSAKPSGPEILAR